MNFEEWYKGMPVITRSFMTGCFLTSLAVYLDLVSPMALYLNFPRITQHMELWRLVTNFFFFDTFGLNFVFHMFFMVRHSKLLEEGSFRGRTGDFLFLYIFGSVLLLIIDYLLFIGPAGLPKMTAMFLAPSLAFVVVYVWSRRNPHVQLSFLGLFNFNAPYLPWVIIGFALLLNHSPTADILGVIVGHIYYFLEDVYPQTTGRRLLKTPGFLKAAFDIAPVPMAARPWGEGVQVAENVRPEDEH
eukprot:TRINITY_DN4394_c0_g1_i1.p1 TRINITY_DN4394_c0_g1~~TRINITY_DN4394_c0_g1_i1.p1  ORF type:complete len:244 (-),score=21.19 TRINITY_DN4394_c0_g1_i1:89-820(-)